MTGLDSNPGPAGSPTRGQPLSLPRLGFCICTMRRAVLGAAAERKRGNTRVSGPTRGRAGLNVWVCKGSPGSFGSADAQARPWGGQSKWSGRKPGCQHLTKLPATPTCSQGDCRGADLGSCQHTEMRVGADTGLSARLAPRSPPRPRQRLSHCPRSVLGAQHTLPSTLPRTKGLGFVQGLVGR